MATQPDEQSSPPEPPVDGDHSGGSGIGPGALATVGLGLIAVAILIWFVWPRFSGDSGADQPATAEDTPAPTSAAGEMITATPAPATATQPPPPTEQVTRATTQPPQAVEPSATPISPTATLPVKVQEGVYARVVGTEIEGLSFRSGPGLNYVRWDILGEGEIIKITGGPEEANDMIWWRGVTQTGLVGWAVEQFLVPVEPPAWTPEPERTPDLTAIAPTPES